jgi:hypothetical protein
LVATAPDEEIAPLLKDYHHLQHGSHQQFGPTANDVYQTAMTARFRAGASRSYVDAILQVKEQTRQSCRGNLVRQKSGNALPRSRSTH